MPIRGHRDARPVRRLLGLPDHPVDRLRDRPGLPDASSLTQTNMTLGTVAYVAPAVRISRGP